MSQWSRGLFTIWKAQVLLLKAASQKRVSQHLEPCSSMGQVATQPPCKGIVRDGGGKWEIYSNDVTLEGEKVAEF